MGRHLQYPGNVGVGTLQSIINPSGTVTFQVSGWPASIAGALPFVVEVGPGLGDDEKILITGFTAGVATVDGAGRGWDSTTAVAHSVGEQVKLVWDATSAQDVDDHLYVTVRDDHTQYLNVARHDLTARHGASVVIHGQTGNLSADDHAQYHNDSRHDAHQHPAGAFFTGGSAVITRSMLAGAAQGLLIGQLIYLPGVLTVLEQTYLLTPDGSAISRTTYAGLFARYGTEFGVGDGSTTFNLPDVRDRVLIGATVGAPGGGRSARPEASVGGAETVTLSSANLAAHVHTVADTGHGHGVTDPRHAHSVAGDFGLRVGVSSGASSEGYQSSPSGDKATFTNIESNVTGVTIATGHAGFSGGNTGSVGSGTSFGILPPFLAANCYVVAL